MKKIIAFIVLAIFTFSACKKDDPPVFNKSPDERLSEAISAYQSKLSSAPNGWKGYIQPKGGGLYSFYFKFNDSNRVSMLSSFDSLSAVTLKESSYRLKALQQPSLLFDTYSYVHVLADPDASVNGGPDGSGFVNGTGLQSDFEFYFDSSSADTINLVGRFNGSKATLIKATPEEEAGFINGQLATGFLLNKIQTYFKRITIGSEQFDFNFNSSAKTISFADATGNLLDPSITTRYYLTSGGIGFLKPLVAGSQNIAGISNINYNISNQTISCTINNNAATISSVIEPIKVDVNAGKRWWDFKASNPNDPYWFSVSGFHVNGVEDAYRLNTLTAQNMSYLFLVYYPNFFGTGSDLFGPIFLNATGDSAKLVYGTVPQQPAYKSDGRAVFTNLGTYGTFPGTGPAAATAIQLFNPRGFYFVQTSESTFDMVSALDGRSWINWQ